MTTTRPILLASALSLIALTVTPTLHAQPAASDADRTFVGKVSQGGAYEVEASKLAEAKATAPDVKDLAATEVHDHELVNRELKKIAGTTGIAIAPKLNAEFQQRLDKLKSTSAADFDAAYVADMQDIHDKDEKLFAQEAQDGSDSFKPFVHNTDLIVKRHIGALHGLDAK